MKHKKKKTLARRMMTAWEIVNKISPFMSKAWQVRKFEKEKHALQNEVRAASRKKKK